MRDRQYSTQRIHATIATVTPDMFQVISVVRSTIAFMFPAQQGNIIRLTSYSLRLVYYSDLT